MFSLVGCSILRKPRPLSVTSNNGGWVIVTLIIFRRNGLWKHSYKNCLPMYMHVEILLRVFVVNSIWRTSIVGDCLQKQVMICATLNIQDM